MRLGSGKGLVALKNLVISREVTKGGRLGGGPPQPQCFACHRLFARASVTKLGHIGVEGSFQGQLMPGFFLAENLEDLAGRVALGLGE